MKNDRHWFDHCKEIVGISSVHRTVWITPLWQVTASVVYSRKVSWNSMQFFHCMSTHNIFLRKSNWWKTFFVVLTLYISHRLCDVFHWLMTVVAEQSGQSGCLRLCSCLCSSILGVQDRDSVWLPNLCALVSGTGQRVGTEVHNIQQDQHGTVYMYLYWSLSLMPRKHEELWGVLNSWDIQHNAQNGMSLQVNAQRAAVVRYLVSCLIHDLYQACGLYGDHPGCIRAARIHQNTQIQTQEWTRCVQIACLIVHWLVPFVIRVRCRHC